MTQDEMWLLKEKYHGEKSAEFFADCARINPLGSVGEPLAYVIGSIPFLNTTIFLDSHPLIPRTETEFWVEKAIAEMDTIAPLRILDLCAGSGCIGVAVLKAIPHACVDFVEIDTAHHPTIQKNILENSIDPTRAHIFGGSLFEQVSGTYDFILTNPPYVDEALGRVAPEVQRHEPALALYGGVHGINIISEIMKEATPFLTPTGILYIEHEPEQSASIASIASEYEFTSRSYFDQFAVLRYTRITRTISYSVTQ